MRAVVQRVSSASVEVDGSQVASIGKGLCVLVGIQTGDTLKDGKWLAKKIVSLRIFPDENGKMSKSLLDEKKEILVISQFTLYCSCKEGRRPDCIEAAHRDLAHSLYTQFLTQIHDELGIEPQKGVFGAHMSVSLINDGPFTLIIDSQEK